MNIPIVEAANEKLQKLKKETAAREAVVMSEVQKANEIHCQWTALLGDFNAANDRFRWTRQKIEIMHKWIGRLREEMSPLVPTVTYSGEFFEAHRVDPSRPSHIFMQWGDDNPFIWYGMRIAGAESAIRELERFLAAFRQKALDSLALVEAFKAEHRIECDLQHELA